jgi:23S rRNA (guanine2445-N2)-methyltransferase / 23S rRNA (guanine2069-N7)-methyltransferase
MADAPRTVSQTPRLGSKPISRIHGTPAPPRPVGSYTPGVKPLFFATASRGTEDVLAAELEQLGIAPVQSTRAGAAFGGELIDGYRACLWSRVASRVLMPLASFDAADPDQLYSGVHAVDWTAHLGPERTLAVNVAGRHSPIGPSHFIALKAKDAIVDRVRSIEGARPDVDKRDPDVRIHIHAGPTRVTVSLDLAGQGLHHRGLERTHASAPLRENLAAALLRITGWPEQAGSWPLLDPMCGSGTILAEAAAMALDVAPGLNRGRLGAEGWRQHDARLWEQLRSEAQDRRARARDRSVRIAGFDASRAAVRTARDYIARAGLAQNVTLEVRSLSEARSLWEDPGILLTNPPYGERLGEVAELGPLYETLGDVLKRSFPGWTAWVLGGNRALEKRIGLRPASRNVLFNGPIECRLLKIPISAVAPTSVRGPGWRRSGDESRGFTRRLRANAKRLRGWIAREKLTCYRLYDADVPLYNVAVDWFDGRVRVEEYPRPPKVAEADADRRLRDALLVVSEVLEVDRADIVLRVPRKPVSDGRAERHGDRDRSRTVSEAGLLYRIALEDQPQVGFPLDERLIRRWLFERAEGRDFLNLSAGTCTATVAAAAGGARSTTSVDPSRVCLEKGRANFDLNGQKSNIHHFVRDDVEQFIRRHGGRRRFGLVLAALPSGEQPPGSVTAKAARLLGPGGEMLFVSRTKGYELAPEDLRGLSVQEITEELTPLDFARRPHLKVWRIGLSDGR